ncbi:MAG: hypothetical protein ABL952_09980 [Pyrinomonadaceae bacterium]
MKNMRNIRFLDKGEALAESATTGVSLHCHTLHSKEILDFVPYYAERIPVVSWLWEREKRRSIHETGRPPEFDSGYWTPPLTSQQVFDMESASVRSMGLDGIVSITDHDSIEAGFELSKTTDEGKAPISMEWTVPFDEAFFHIGVHNLPASSAREIQEQLLAYTFAGGVPDDARLSELFAMLCEFPDVLIVLNHPIWDIEMIGQKRHEAALGKFLLVHQRWFHAIEVNGFRAWHENEVAIELAEQLGLPIVSGGDRHCMHNNTMINVSNAATFSEFVDDIRVGGHSRIVVTPEYQTALPSRQLSSIAHILGNYSDFPIGRRVWSDRIYFDAKDGSGLMTLTERWNGRQPWWATAALGCLTIMANPVMRKGIEFTIGDADIGRDDSTPAVNEDRTILPPAYTVTQ